MTNNPFITELIDNSEKYTKNNESFTDKAIELIKAGKITVDEITFSITGENPDRRLHCFLTEAERYYFIDFIDDLLKE